MKFADAMARQTRQHPAPANARMAGPHLLGPAAGEAATAQDRAPALDRTRFPVPGIARSSGRGAPLPAPLRSRFEAAADADFSDVRIHVGPHAPALGANAFATGSRLYFAPGAYNPATTAGRALIGHELGHVLQQRSGRASGGGAGLRTVRSPALEGEADRFGATSARFVEGPGAAKAANESSIFSGAAPAPAAPGEAGDVIQGDRLSDFLTAIVLMALGHGFLGREGGQLGLLLGMMLFQRNESRRELGGAPDAALSRRIANLPAPRNLGHLDENRWWPMFIDPSHREEARGLPDPSMLYDTQQSPGYKASMTSAFRAELLPAHGRLPHGPVADYDEYNRLHNLVTEHLPHDSDANFSHVRRPSGREVFPPTNFPIGGHDRLAADIAGERIAGRPLVSVWRPGTSPDRLPGITFYDAEGQRLQVNYDTREGRGLVEATLARYHTDIRNARTSRLGRLRAIARCIRALHVIHAFRDANGRLHITFMMQKMLQEQGFSPVILQNDPEVFGGSYTVDELVAVMIRGMHAFDAETRR